MGDWFQNVVDVDASDEEAGRLAERLLRWLIESGIVVGTPSDNVFGAEGGYGPGPRYAAAVTAPNDSVLTLSTNGLHLIEDRCVYHCGQDGVGPVVCPWCGARDVLEDPGTYRMNDRWEDLSDSFDRWLAGGDGELECLHCQRMVGLKEWRWEAPVYAFGSLGVEIWNWPPLTGSFVADVARVLGHRVVVNGGKL